jgi:hypothetical protein
MRHPFDGLNCPEQTRRAALGTMVGAAAGLLGLNASAGEQRVTTLALGEEGGPTTGALGEEGGPGAGMKALTTEPFGEEAGKVTSRPAPGLEDGGPGAITQAVNEDGGPLTTGLRENGGVVTDALGEDGGFRPGGARVAPAARELTEKQMKAAWDDLGDKDPAKALQGCAILYGAKKAVPFLKENLKYKAPELDEKRVAKLVADLDNDSFEVREKAEADLAAVGPAAAPALEKALRESPGAEVSMRLTRLLNKAKEQPAVVQAQRGLQVLVALQTAESKDLLEALAKGPDKEWMTQAAKAALAGAPKK